MNSQLVRVFILSFVVIGGLVGVVKIGLSGKPEPFPPMTSLPKDPTVPTHKVAIPADLPSPVRRYLAESAGAEVPIIKSAVITGHGSLTFSAITFPARMRFSHRSGYDYRHYLECFFFGKPVLVVNERFLHGIGRMELPFGTVENEPNVNSAANLGLWGESLWLPSLFVTDPRVRWEPIDSTHATLIVPAAPESPDQTPERFTTEFDPNNGMLVRAETMRYRSAEDKKKILWRLEVMEWKRYDGILVPSLTQATWMDQGKPWLVIRTDDVVFNVQIEEYLEERGF